MNTMDMLYNLVNTYSPSGHEDDISKLIREYLTELDFEDPVIDRSKNVISDNGSGKSILLCGHEDTVPGFIEPRIKNNLIYGRGAVDAKASLLALMLGAHRAIRNGFNKRILFVAAAGEESTSKGINSIIKSYKPTDYAIFGEPGNYNNITCGYRGRMLIKISMSSETHHASASNLYENPVSYLIDVWNKIRELYSNNHFDQISAAITRFSGGKYHNVTPESAYMYIDVRYPASESESFIDNIYRAAGRATVKVVSRVPPYISNFKSDLIRSFKNAISYYSSPGLIVKSGTGDMNILGSSWKIPSITYGPGDTRLSHTKNEVININEVERSIDIISRALQHLASL
ncbi:M20/M25/M40 family metallo-hydrolase [Picrophilus oshimae]|uniref:Putative [LysW]-lysine/[LysW]-ornithine hydrolase n=1 Tax=Picrophilus torridus (strain ATCC 700027 / DSM 9790 / JCM 10055 / NBRC 100828 / KAW 2/3) TaxID=1122961 RepID=A0A8G2FWN6_PICTO|nr:M20/M25/M40 family metallo-hydrolase [Picrophilus oshimae]SMD30876.1 N2-acetyl-L-lysine deacetylase /acetylornithine deacetylase [Picrophilus oshimae DSM 9789]